MLKEREKNPETRLMKDCIKFETKATKSKKKKYRSKDRLKEMQVLDTKKNVPKVMKTWSI